MLLKAFKNSLKDSFSFSKKRREKNEDKESKLF